MTTTVYLVIIQILAFPLPNHLRNNFLTFFIKKWYLDRTAVLSRFSVVIARNLRMERHAIIKPFTFVGRINTLNMAELANIGTLNYISGSLPPSLSDRHSSYLYLDYGASVTSLHRIDCSGGFRLGRNSIVAGYMTQVLTHSVDIYRSCQDHSPVLIGDFCFIGSRCTLLPGALVNSFVVMGACSLCPGKYILESYHLYCGQPVYPVKSLPKDLKFFIRAQPAIRYPDC